MKIAMIHFPDVTKDYSEYDVLTFDDGLYAHFVYFDFFKQFNKPMKFCISTNLVYDKGRDDTTLRKDYMSIGFCMKDKEQFMNWDEIKFLSEQENVEIVAHSHYHEIVASTKPGENPAWRRTYLQLNPMQDRLLSTTSALATAGLVRQGGKFVPRTEEEYIEFIIKDTNLMMKSFNDNLGYVPSSYCFPYNKSNILLEKYLEGNGFTIFYGPERIDV